VLLAHDVDGSGEAVVLLHSGVSDRRMWQPQWTALLAAGRRVVRADFRGHGETPAPTEPYDNAGDVRDLLDAHGIEQAAVLGSSFGGRVALEFASTWPDRVTDLVLLCAAYPGHPRSADFAAFAEREDALLEAGDLDAAVALNVATFLGPEADQDTRDLVARMQRRAFELQLPAPEVDAITHDIDLAHIAARTLVVSGRHDLEQFEQIADVLGAGIAGARQIRLDWAGHLPSLENPSLVNDLLLDFLRR
jgi:3-oxoadipate enol-lactonase